MCIRDRCTAKRSWNVKIFYFPFIACYINFCQPRTFLIGRLIIDVYKRQIVTNGDQTDTIYELMDKQQTFEQALRTREFEPDGPNYTPRISGIMHVENGEYNYAMSILKSNNGNPDACNRYTFAYENPVAGEGHFIHTYMLSLIHIFT